MSLARCRRAFGDQFGAGRGAGVAYSAELKVCPMARADDWDLGSGVGSTEAVRQRGGVVDVDRSDSA